MRTKIKPGVFVGLNALLLLVVSTGCLSQLYSLDEANLDLNWVSDSREDQDILEADSNNLQGDDLGYFVEKPLPDRDTRQVDMDALKELVDKLRQSDERQLMTLQLDTKHLPSSGTFRAEDDTSISNPVNDPADFDVSLSQLTNSLNHWIPNTSNRSALLDGLLSSYLEQQLHLGNNLFQPRGAPQEDNDTLLPVTTQRSGSEYIDQPLSLFGHQYVQGGAGEGHQLLGPDGTFQNIQVIKTDLAVPAYCNPPNPCPIGYTAADGCLEEFVNSASFSRDYQVKQKCSCDNEHSLFNCGEPPSSSNNLAQKHNRFNSQSEQQQDSFSIEENSKQLDTLARAIENRFGNVASVRNLIGSYSESMY